MALSPENVSMALFCDFENVALGVRDANYDKFDIKRVLERLLLKGSIVVKKAYCDWERYKGFKATMHEANFELIEIPHVRQSGKNSADIRLVVDALDLCYTKSHVNTFVIISGDSDFSPLVSKLRENAKYVIGVGVKQSTSDLLIANCDEFIFYDDLVRDSQREAARRDSHAGQPVAKRSPEEERRHREDKEKRKQQAMDLAVETFDALVAERGDSGKIWASVLKEAIKRRKPDFNESYYGFRAFGNLIEEAQARGLLEFGRDEKSGAYVFRSSNTPPAPRREPEIEHHVPRPALAAAPATAIASTAPVTAPSAESDASPAAGRSGGRRQGRGKRATASANPSSNASTATATTTTNRAVGKNSAHEVITENSPTPQAAVTLTQLADETKTSPPAASIPGGRRQGRNSQTTTAKTTGKSAPARAPQDSAPITSRPAESKVATPASVLTESGQPAAEAKARKAAPRNRRPRKTDAGPATE